MRLGIDLRCLTEGEQGGIATYASALVPRLARLFPDAGVGFVSGVGVTAPTAHFPVKHLHWPNKFLNASLVTLQQPKIDALMDAEVVFAPTPKFLALRPGTPLVLTVHDLSFVDHPEYFTARQRLWHSALRITSLLRRSQRIIAVSQHTAGDIIRLVPDVAERVTVVHSGADHGPSTAPARLGGLPERYFFAFAPAEPRKNVANLLAAHRLAFPHTGVPLVLVGSGRFTPEAGVIRLPHLSTTERWQVLGNALALLYPSLYEGFGFPPLEAMRLGVPVVASHVTSLPEVLGEAALYVDAWDPQDIAGAMRTLGTDAELRTRLRQRGRGRASEFQWDNAATKTADIITDAYAHRH